ncbi:PPE family protein [Mycobacterium kiyosense]|uniref:PPE family protein n=1 Tax=Mycobacterium kiyosense TaxID=2871094 RepID=UPI00216B9889|nr:PPE family protein [Mycobacterium kiyosense]GLB89180.1 putative PPE family protein PPE33 [Mycobacterium kiyosense]GLC00029.1 putative PPE family protein PPE33 [Mycobacterium kiyosense]GLC05552.1 putative PPE family protein PPE33 [Mycobacterium kiyosense]GLC11944.1 putative PPE family protein PPE33 [Mycobacterium kiyosense]GLC18165.1 putative PPE family protein PPE33 [Mycobacterium kiyosense]
MFYAAFPPEINSGRIYSGPGSGPMLAAAAAWNGLAAELQATAMSYSSVIAGLTSGPWVGPSSLAMAAAATPYVAWMSSTAAQAAQAAEQAVAAASAYEAAFAGHVPPSQIAANRSYLATLVATNLFGQNTAAIAATEAQYGEMWAQDAVAMDGYAASSAAATDITPFTEPPQIVNVGGLVDQALSAGQTLSNSVGAATQSILSASTPLTQLLQVGANLSTDYTATINGLLNGLFGSSGATTFTTLYSAVKVPLGFTTQFNDIGLLVNFPASQFLKFGPKSISSFGELPKDALGGGLTPHWGRGWLTSAVTPSPTANFGRGTLVGSLTVPPSWTANTPAIRTVAAALSAAGPEAVPAAELGRGGLLSSMSLAGMAGSAFGAGAPSAVSGARGRITPVKDLKDLKSPEMLKRMVAQISERPESVQHHTVDQEGLDALLEQLAKRPGVHAVHLTKSTPKVVPADAQSG